MLCTISYFNPRSPRGERLAHLGEQAILNKISIHAPRGGSDHHAADGSSPHKRFQSTLPVGGATEAREKAGLPPVFQSTLPVGGATTSPSDFRRRFIFQSTLPVGGATSSKLCADPCARISIHAPRGGSDSQRGHGIGVPVPISIHTPRGGSDTSKVEPLPMVFVFQSTLPTGGATRPAAVLLRNQPISIHAPRGGERPYIRTEWSIPGGFQSTLPVGGATNR